MAYTTTKGNVHDTISRKLWAGIRQAAFSRFDGSMSLFNACWREYRGHLNGAIDDPEDIADVMGWLDQIAAEKVNNPRSQYYIYG